MASLTKHEARTSSDEAKAAPTEVVNPFDRRRWMLGVLVVSAIFLIQMASLVVLGRPREVMIVRLAVWMLEMPIMMLLLSAYYRRATQKHIGSGRVIVTSLSISFVAGALCTLVIYFLISMFPSLGMKSELITDVGKAISYGGVFGLLQCCVWTLAFVYPFAAEDARLRSVEAEKLKLEAAQLRSAAELARLRSQFEPHFLLNTLNAIAGLVTQDPREARRLLAALGDLLSDALRDPDEMQTLDEEVAWLRRYAQILESRHAGSLHFQWEIDSSARTALVPRLLLQPLVENAVKHGALRRSGGGHVIVRASVDEADPARKRVVCTIEDNGPGMSTSEPRSGAFGLRAVRRRLDLKFADATFRMESNAEGTRSIVDLPRMTGNNGRSELFDRGIS